MLSEKRRGDILKLVGQKKSVTVQELKNALDASESTIRRDITSLSKEGKLIKVFGGAIAVEGAPSSKELTVGQKKALNKEEKLRIARYAASLIRPGDYVYIDSGTTTGYMLEFIKEKDATYVTNAVAHAKTLALKGLKVLLIGGELKETTEAIVGADAILHIQKYHFSKGFFGTNGISIKLGFTTPDVREALIKRVAIQNTQLGQRYIMADAEKFGQVSSVTFADLDGTVTLTDRQPDDVFLKKMEIRVV